MTLRESIRNHTVKILLINEFKKHFFSTIKEDKGRYKLIINDLGKVPIDVGSVRSCIPIHTLL